jgi:hypothetical protein
VIAIALALQGPLLAAASPPPLGAIAGAVAAGALVGVLGHIVRSRLLILVGIIVIAAVSAYFSFVLQPGS